MNQNPAHLTAHSLELSALILNELTALLSTRVSQLDPGRDRDELLKSLDQLDETASLHRTVAKTLQTNTRTAGNTATKTLGHPCTRPHVTHRDCPQPHPTETEADSQQLPAIPQEKESEKCP